MPAIQQECFSLRYQDMLVTFEWPVGSDLVTITNSLGQSTDYSVPEAHDIFWMLLNAGAY